MAIIWGAVISAAASAVSGAVKSRKQKKAANALDKGLDVKRQAKRLGVSLEDAFGKRVEAPEFNFSEEDIFRITERLAVFNAGRGTDLANQSASKINANTLNDLEAGMRRLFGDDAFESQRSKTNQIVGDQLDGKLSQSTRQILSRRALSSGASGIGQGAVEDQYASYLGTTTEEITQRGVDNYRSLYSQYRQSFPLVTGLQTLPNTTMTPTAGVDFAIRTAENQYAAELNEAFADASPDPVAAGLLGGELSRFQAVNAARLGAANTAADTIGNAGAAFGGAVANYGENKQTQQYRQESLDLMRTQAQNGNLKFDFKDNSSGVFERRERGF